MFDIHCHILPAVDDGAKNEGSTKRMLEIAYQDGIHTIVSTPHFSYESNISNQTKIKENFEIVKSWWKNHSPDNQLFLGNEILYCEEIVDLLNQGKALTMNETQYVLIEFPIYIDFITLKRGVQALLYAHYIPIIAHIERYECLSSKEKIEELVSIGAYTQVNASTILGKHGFATKRFALKLLKCSMVHFIATDAHNSHTRKPELKKCAFYLKRKIGTQNTYQLLEENPLKMLNGLPITTYDA